METEHPYYRTFIALPVRVGREVMQARDQLMEALAHERISWVNPANYHVTLRFLGDTDKKAIPQIKKALHQGLEPPWKSKVSLTGPDSFGSRKTPRVIWLGFDQQEPFHSLFADVDRVLHDCGFPSANQYFRAHLTLGRIRSLTHTASFYEIIEKMKGAFTASVLLDRIIFYKSELGAQGPTYTKLYEKAFSDQPF